MFKQAIVRRPAKSLIHGMTSANLGKPDYDLALHQHNQYVEALKRCGLQVTILPAEETFPDSVFVEDTAVVTEKWGIITRPGAKKRQGEEITIKCALQNFFHHLRPIQPPGTLDGGDVLQVENQFFVGLSSRTNIEGYQQFSALIAPFGCQATAIKMKNFLHLKSGLTYLQRNNLLVAEEFVQEQRFKDFKQIVVIESETYAANCLWINDTVLVPAGFPTTQTAIAQAGYNTMCLEVSEFQKLDGGLSCLSLRF